MHQIVLHILTVSKGISGHLLKASAQRRRSKAQIKEEKKAEERKQKQIAEKLAAYDEMERKVSQVDEVVAERENYRQICKSMYDEGIIKQDD